jgi:hypothetical protein
MVVGGGVPRAPISLHRPSRGHRGVTGIAISHVKIPVLGS